MVALCSNLQLYYVALPSSFVSGRRFRCLWLLVVAVVVGVFRYCLLWLSLFYVTLDVVIGCCFLFVRLLSKQREEDREVGGGRLQVRCEAQEKRTFSQC